MKNKFEKNDLIFYFQEYDFPKQMIAKDVLIHRDLIFNEESEEPELNQSKKKIKYSGCFIIEDELESKGKGGFKKGNNTGKTFSKPLGKPKENVWRKNEPEENSGGFFDNFNGKTDEKQVAKFKRNIEVHVVNENSISIEKSIYVDHILKPKHSKVENTLKFYEVNKEEVKPISADNFFDNADKIMGLTPDSGPAGNHVENHQISKLNDYLNNNIDLNPKVVNIEQIFKINKYLGYPKEEQLWYIFHPNAKSSFGPLSSFQIKQMYETKVLNGQSEVRFIDIYNLKTKKPFSFFLLKEIEHPNFLEEIDISPLLRVAVGLKSKNISEKREEKTAAKTEVTILSNTTASSSSSTTTVSKTSSTTFSNTTIPSTSQPTSISNNSSSLSTVSAPIKENKSITQAISKNDMHYQNDSIYNLPSNPQPEYKKIEPEKKSIVEAFFDETPSTTINKSNKNKKLPKGKPVDVDVKLGFKLDEENEVKSKNSKPINFISTQNIISQPINNTKNRNYNNRNNNSLQQQNNYNNFETYNDFNDYSNQDEANYDYNYYQNNDYGGGSIYQNNYRNNNFYKK